MNLRVQVAHVNVCLLKQALNSARSTGNCLLTPDVDARAHSAAGRHIVGAKSPKTHSVFN